MLMFTQLPILAGSKERPMTPVNVEDLKTVGVSNNAFALHTGDTITFPDQDPLVVSQKIRNTEDSPLAYYVGVEKNGKPSLLSVGYFTRRDVNGNPIGEFQAKNLDCANFLEMYNLWRGKTIKGGETKSFDMAKFSPSGERLEGETRKQSFCVAII